MRSILDGAETLGVGIGGTTLTAWIGDQQVFIKLLPLTAVEEGDPLSTRNLRELPFAAHLGIGSPSCGLGRELAVHRTTSEWVREGAADFFPILYGWRMVESPCAIDLSEFDGAAPPRRWGDSWPRLEKRLEDLRQAEKSAAVFLEYVPETLGQWMSRSVRGGQVERELATAVEQILFATRWMSERGLHHFDVHPGNILVRDDTLLFTDFGLSLQADFELTVEERARLPSHTGFDRDSGLMHLFHWLLYELGYTTRESRLNALMQAAGGLDSPGRRELRRSLGGSFDLLADHAEVAVSMSGLFDELTADAHGADYASVAG